MKFQAGPKEGADDEAWTAPHRRSIDSFAWRGCLRARGIPAAGGQGREDAHDVIDDVGLGARRGATVAGRQSRKERLKIAGKAGQIATRRGASSGACPGCWMLRDHVDDLSYQTIHDLSYQTIHDRYRCLCQTCLIDRSHRQPPGLIPRTPNAPV